VTIITAKMIVGQFANYAVRQHPYGRPEGLFEIVGTLKAASEEWTEGLPDLRMKTFPSFWAIEDWLRQALQDPQSIATLQLWNTASSGSPDGFMSRYNGPSPEDDFIDIDALLRNVARETWNEAQRDDESDARIEARLGHGPNGPETQPEFK